MCVIQKGAVPVDENKCKYQNATVVCSHFGDHRDRSGGARPNQHVFSSRCPVKFRFSWNALLQKYHHSMVPYSICVHRVRRQYYFS